MNYNETDLNQLVMNLTEENRKLLDENSKMKESIASYIFEMKKYFIKQKEEAIANINEYIKDELIANTVDGTKINSDKWMY